MEGNLRFKIDWASLVVGRKFTVFAVFYFVLEGNFQVKAPGGLIFGGAIQRRVFCVTGLGGLYLEGLMHMVLDTRCPKSSWTLTKRLVVTYMKYLLVSSVEHLRANLK